MRSDVPIAFCLSGGIDSGALVSIASKVLGKKISCFSIVDSDERYNEYDNIKKIVKDLSKKYECLCFDEFYVEDIADAMLLGKFMSELFKSDFLQNEKKMISNKKKEKK